MCNLLPQFFFCTSIFLELCDTPFFGIVLHFSHRDEVIEERHNFSLLLILFVHSFNHSQIIKMDKILTNDFSIP